MLNRSVTLLSIFSLIAPSLFLHQRSYAVTREPSYAKHAMVASQHPLASKIGVEVLKRGGNAVDAAIAVGLALAVVYPEAGNIGGGGFMLIRKPNGETSAIDYREMAPAAASRDMFVNEKGEVIRGEGGSSVGYRASGVPGTMSGFDLAFKKHGSGKVNWASLVEPSRMLAANGYVLTHRLAELFKSYKETLSKYPESNRIFLRDGKFFEAGEVLRQPALAATLGRIKTLGAKEFYTGRTARLIAADMKANNGLITEADLKNYVAKERTPLKGTYRGHEIITMPPPSSGGIVMLQVLNMLERDDIRGLGSGSAAKFHLFAEASRRAFADRAEYMADPDFADVPVAKLTEKSYAASRRATINADKADTSASVRFGDVGAGTLLSPSTRQISSTGNFGNELVRPADSCGQECPRSEGTETTHYTIIDKDGMVVSNTYTINDLYGSRVTIKGTGILMNDEMDDFASRPNTPNIFGLIQGERNKVEGGKRPLSSMTPTIVLRTDGSFWFAVGARGGPRIISAVMQTVINVIDHDMNIQDAIDAPRIHQQWLPDEIAFEPHGISPDTRKILDSYGHKFAQRPGNIASATGVMVTASGLRIGAIDSRSDGEAIGY